VDSNDLERNLSTRSKRVVHVEAHLRCREDVNEG